MASLLPCHGNPPPLPRLRFGLPTRCFILVPYGETQGRKPGGTCKTGGSQTLQGLAVCGIIVCMLIPQFSLRWLLAVMTGCAVVFSVVGLGVRGHVWAAGISIGIGSLVILATIYALLFGMAWTFSVVTSALGFGGGTSSGSPFQAPLGESPFGRGSATGNVAGNLAGNREAIPATPILLDDSPTPPRRP